MIIAMSIWGALMMAMLWYVIYVCFIKDPREPKSIKPAYNPDKCAQIEKELGMTSKLEKIRDLSVAGQFQATAELYRHGTQYYVLSTAHLPMYAELGGPWESMVFRCDADGNTRSMSEVVGCRARDMYTCHGECLVLLEEFCQRGID